jgi:hypothetical protein
MNFPRIALAAVAAWIAAIAVGYVVNDFLLADLMRANQAAMRPEAELTARLPVGFVFLLLAFFAFAYAFAKGYEGTNSVMEGVRFGVLVGLMVLGLGVIWQWVVYPIDAAMAVSQVIYTIAESALYGAIVGAIYRPLEAAARQRTAPA